MCVVCELIIHYKRMISNHQSISVHIVLVFIAQPSRGESHPSSEGTGDVFLEMQHQLANDSGTDILITIFSVC